MPKSSCTRYMYGDVLFEVVALDGELSSISEEALQQWISSFPIGDETEASAEGEG